MPENIKWELISFGLKVLPIIVGLVLAWIAAKKPSAKKAFAEVQGILKEAVDIVNQTFVDPRKKGGTWSEEDKAKAREIAWQKFMELATVKAEYWLKYLLDTFGEAKLKELIVDSDTGGMVEAVIKK